jgi:dihydrofolate reductase
VAKRLIYYVACTVDGFIARKDGSFDCFLFEGPHFRDLIAEFPETFPSHLRAALGIKQEARRFDTVLMGRNTWEVGLREGITSPYTPLRQYIVSRTITSNPDPAVAVHRQDPVDLVRRLKLEDGLDIWLCGGSKLAGALASEIDELIVKINPVVIGAGLPLFEGFDGTVRSTLIGHKTYPNGFVLARYTLH